MWAVTLQAPWEEGGRPLLVLRVARGLLESMGPEVVSGHPVSVGGTATEALEQAVAAGAAVPAVAAVAVEPVVAEAACTHPQEGARAVLART